MQRPRPRLCSQGSPSPSRSVLGGEVRRPRHDEDLVSCTPKAQKHFNRAALLLYSYYWAPTEKALTEVLQADPTCVMAYWAAAVAKMDNPYASPPTPKALEEAWWIIEKAKSIGAKTQRERDYIEAIEVFYKDYDKLDHRTRGAAHEKALEQLYLRYPQDTEAAMYYARWLIAMADPRDKDYTRQLKAAANPGEDFREAAGSPGRGALSDSCL